MRWAEVAVEEIHAGLFQEGVLVQTRGDADSPSLVMRAVLLLLGCGGHHHKGEHMPRLQTERAGKKTPAFIDSQILQLKIILF